MPIKNTRTFIEENAPVTKGDFRELVVVIGNAFEKIDKRIDRTEENLGRRIQGVQNSLDAHILDSVSRDEHNRLKKRVRMLELA